MKFEYKFTNEAPQKLTYEIEGKTLNDIVRAYTMVDIFDTYYDKLKGTGKVVKIQSGYGNVRPNLYGKIKTNDND